MGDRLTRSFLIVFFILLGLIIIIAGIFGFYSGKINGFASLEEGVGELETEAGNVMLSPPPTPTGLRVEPSTTPSLRCSQVLLCWDNPGNGLKVKLYKDGKFFVLREVHTCFGDRVMGSSNYSYQISTINSQGEESPLSDPTNVITNACHEKNIAIINFSVVLIKLPGFSEPYSREYVYDKIFTDEYSLKKYVEEDSYGRQTIQGNVYGWYTLPGNAEDYCNIIYSDGKGGVCRFPLDQFAPYPEWYYDTTFYLVEGLRGQAYGAWEADDFSLWKMVHSGMPQITETISDPPAVENCPNTNNPIPSTIIIEGTTTNEFIDGCQSSTWEWFDPGGIGDHFHHNAFSKEMAGYLQPNEIDVANQTGEYIIDALEVPSDGVKELKIPLTEKIFYFLEYRRPIGFDSDISDNFLIFGHLVESKADGVQIRLRTEGYHRSILHLMPYKYINQTNRFYDPYRGIRISLIEKNDTAAKVFVEHGVFDTIPPTVQITTPNNNQQFSTTFTAGATASDDMMVDKVEFYFNNNLVGTDLLVPFSYNIDIMAISNGDYNLTARAIDLAGNSNNHSIKIKVRNSGQCNTDADSNCDGNVDGSELQNYVIDYYTGEASIGEVSEAILEFLS